MSESKMFIGDWVSIKYMSPENPTAQITSYETYLYKNYPCLYLFPVEGTSARYACIDFDVFCIRFRVKSKSITFMKEREMHQMIRFEGRHIVRTFQQDADIWKDMYERWL